VENLWFRSRTKIDRLRQTGQVCRPLKAVLWIQKIFFYDSDSDPEIFSAIS
jgi:hypothetical protein